MMHRAGDTFGHECANIDFHECENASTLILIMYMLTFLAFRCVTMTEL